MRDAQSRSGKSRDDGLEAASTGDLQGLLPRKPHSACLAEVPILKQPLDAARSLEPVRRDCQTVEVSANAESGLSSEICT